MDRDRFDDLLDEALRSYGGEPRAGLERRVIARVRASGSRGRVGWLVGAVGLAGVAVSVWVLDLRMPEPPQAPRVVAAVVVDRAPDVAQVVKAPRHRRARVVPFPSPSPLTGEERALVMFATRYAVLGEKVPISVEPITVPALRIEPLSGGL